MRTVRPNANRVRQHRGLDGRRRRLPLPTRVLLGLSVLALGGAVFLTATGSIGGIVGTLGAGFANALGRLVATPAPTQAVVVVTGAPVIAQPAAAYVNTSTVDLKIYVPQDVIGQSGAKVRIYLALQGLAPAPIQEVDVSSSATLTVAVHLTKGRNDFTATVVNAGVESDPSPVVTMFLDQTPPHVTIKSPKNGSTVNDPSGNLTLKGVTEANATLVGLDDQNGVSVTVTAADDGTFQMVIALAPGTNTIHINATDLAGNQSTTDLSYLEGSGQITASLRSSVYLISISHHPSSIKLTVTVTDSTGAPVVGATASFVLQIPGLGPISGSATTGSDGRASFTTPLNGTMNVGNGQATVLVTDSGVQSTDRVALTFVK
ncbi:MAG TPA: Ig-like domain-containing protein [Candidatus Limnocylindrales bacterium]|nr:Ig-like domain-containing protein [Candidatus Limnocylindrales bacterium]